MIEITTAFLPETTEIRRHGTPPHKYWKIQTKPCQPRILSAEKKSFKNEGKIKTFSSETKLREFTASKQCTATRKAHPNKLYTLWFHIYNIFEIITF